MNTPSVTPPVLFEDAAFFAVNKPPGMLVIPGRGEGTGPSLRERFEAERRAKIFVVHRLDRDTSGVLLFAKTAEAHRALSMAFEAQGVRKRYLALVEGDVREPLRLDVALAPARRGRMKPVRPGEEGKDALTLVEPVERFTRFSWIRAEPRSGRTHQIRVHLQFAGHPLAFDHQYGRDQALLASDLGGEGKDPVISRTPLHAESVELPALLDWAPRRIEAPLAEDLTAALTLLRR